MVVSFNNAPPIIYKLPPRDRKFEENWDLYNGEHFKYWVGSFPSEKHPNREKLIAELKKAFVFANLVKEVANRHVDALISEAPDITAKPRNAPTTDAITEGEETTDPVAYDAENTIREWLETQTTLTISDYDDDVNPLTQAVVKMVVGGKGYLRLFSRKRYQKSPNLNQRVSLHCPENSAIAMVYDDEGSLEAIEYLFDNGKIERQVLDPETGILNFTIYDSREAQLSDRPSTIEPPYSLDLNYNWSIFALNATPIITDSVITLQNSINLVLTMLGRNVVTAGFLERLLLNAQSPGSFKEDAQGDLQFVADPNGFSTGAGSVGWVSGLPIGDPRNPEGYTTPEAVFREPVAVDSFEKSLEIFTRRLYHETGQGHILTQGDGSISGVSRIQLSQDFRSTIRRHCQAVESILNNMFYSAIMMLSHLDGEKTDKFKSVTITTKLRLSDHLASPEEIAQIRDNFTAGIMSHPTTLGLLGIDDVQVELDMLAEEKEAKMTEMAQTLEIESSFAPPATQQPPKKKPAPKG